MKSIAIQCGVALMLLVATHQDAFAGGHGGFCGGPRIGIGIGIGPGFYYGGGYPYPYAYPYPYYPYGYPYPYYYGIAPAPVAVPSAYAQGAPTSPPPSQGPSTYSQTQPTPSQSMRLGPQDPSASTPRQTYAQNAAIDVRLPDPQGEVWVDGQRLGGAGMKRTFRDRAAQGSDHVYKITAAWHENGQLVTEERLVGVTNGQKPVVDFTRKEQTASNNPPPPPEPYQPR